MVKVTMATLTSGEDGVAATLMLSTTEGAKVEFALDDLAVVMLSMTGGFLHKELKARAEAKTPIIFKRDGES